MIAENDSIEVGGTTFVSSSDQLPNSRKVYVSGELHSHIRVPFREISLATTKSMDGTLDPNEPVRVYDTSGPWGDSDFRGDVEQGLPPLRAKWIRDRGDVEEIEAAGRFVSRQRLSFRSSRRRNREMAKRKPQIRK